MAVLLVLGLAGQVLGQAPAVAYVYDRLGRLIAVVDAVANQAAIYRYDAVGNLLSIARQSASVVSVLTFTPASGPVGTSVTISGIGFGPTAGQNTVTFNGAAATAVFASPTRLVVTVPALATTGPIAVTVPGGSATSDQSFTVGTPGAPTITGLSPTIGTPGTAVIITGTNFDTAASSRVAFNTNVRLGAVSAATSTTVQAVVPGAVGSGRITVTTPQGQAASAQDFFVPPSPYTAGQVAVTDRFTLGGGRTVSLATAGTIAILVFEAVAGQQLSVALSGVTIAQSDVSVRNPDGTLLGTGSVVTTAGAVLFPHIATTGTHALIVAPQGTNTGSLIVASAVLTPSLASAPAALTVGGTALVSWSGLAFPTSTDWIGLYAPGAPDTPSLKWRYTTGGAGGTVPFTLPSGLAPGSYELRMFANDGYTRMATTTVSVAACQGAGLSALPAAVTGTSVTAAWTCVGAPTSTDWIGLYAPGGPDSPALVWFYTAGTASGGQALNIPSELAAGSYELRLFASNGYTRLATSGPLTLARPDLRPTALSAAREVWASSATASSQYSAANWSALQAAGPPNVASCGDNPAAWAPSTTGAGAEWLQASFATAVAPLGVLVHETYVGGFVYRINLVDTAGGTHTVWAGGDVTGCPDWLAVRFPKTAYLVNAVKIYTQKAGYEEIDAVGLITDDTLVVPAATPTPVAVTWTVASQGAGDAVGPWSDTIYVSSSAVCCAGATALGSFTSPATVAAGTSYSQTRSVTIPALPAGSYYLIVRADSGSAVPDTTRANNDSAVPLTISP